MVYDCKSDITGTGNRSLTNLDDTSALQFSARICFPVFSDYMSAISILGNVSLITLDKFLYLVKCTVHVLHFCYI